jgi:hypothetical protein
MYQSMCASFDTAHTFQAMKPLFKLIALNGMPLYRSTHQRQAACNPMRKVTGRLNIINNICSLVLARATLRWRRCCHVYALQSRIVF